MNPDERRQAIVDAALAVALRKGLAGTTVRDVAAEMDTSSGLIHHYFASMDEVLAAAFETGRRRRSGGDSGGDGVGRPTRSTSSSRIWCRTPRSTRTGHFRSGSMPGRRRLAGPPLQRASVDLNVAWQQLLVKAIESGIEQGVMTCSDPEAAAWRILSLQDGLSLQVVAHGTILDRLTVSDWVARIAELELGLSEGALGRTRSA